MYVVIQAPYKPLYAAQMLSDVQQILVRLIHTHTHTHTQEEVQEMRSGMAEFRSHLESYDSQLADVKRSAGDATHGVSQVNDKVLLLRRNVTTLRGSLSALQLDHTDTANSLDLLATVS